MTNTLSTTGLACHKYDTKRGRGDGPDIFKSNVPFTHRLPTTQCGPQRGKDFVKHDKYFFNTKLDGCQKGNDNKN